MKRQESKPKINLILYFLATYVYLELTFKIMIFGIANLFTLSFIYSTIFGGILSIVIVMICRLFHMKVSRKIALTINCLICVTYALQFFMKKIFNTFFSISLFGIADQAVSFTGTAIIEILKNLPFIIILFMPYIVMLFMRLKINFHHPLNKRLFITDGIFALFMIIIMIININIVKNNENSAYSLFYQVDNNAMSIEKLGVNVASYLDIKKSIFGFKENVNIESVAEPTANEEKNSKPKYDYNNLDIDFNALESIETNTTLKNMDSYFESDQGTLKNEYTGMYKGKNLIVIMGESLNTIAISEKYTPTLYKLSHESFVFNNFYTPVNLSTLGGEYQDLTGLFANLSELTNVWRKVTNYYPFGLGTVFNNINYNTYAYHANYGTFQDRNVYLKKLGFNNFLYRGNGLEKKMNCNLWPQSDLDLVDVTYDDWLNSSEPFMSYYVSVSGHMPWSWSSNNMSKKNKDMLEGSGYSEEAAAYIAANIELDKAVQELIDKLSAANKLDDTVIAIVPDHYPYSMNINTINELSTFPRDDVIGANKSTLIIWNNKTKTTEINKVSSQLDFIPTLYNLFGIDYDSRLFMGKDILSTYDGLAYFTNRSWVSDLGTYYASNNQFIPNENVDISEDYVANINKVVQNRINISKLIMENDYYKKVLGSDN